MGWWEGLYWVGLSACSGIEKKMYSYYLCGKKSIYAVCFLKALPIPSARSIEFILSGTHWTGEVLDYSIFHVKQQCY